MSRKAVLLFPLAALTLATLACSFNIDVPDINLKATKMKTGPLQTESFAIPAFEADTQKVRLEFGAGELNLTPGAGSDLLAGTAEYNVTDLKPEVIRDTAAAEVRLRTGDIQFDGIPTFDDNLRNTWNLELGPQPMDLTIQAGAYQGRLELGGLSLRSLDVSDGAADVELGFASPNPIEMSVLTYTTGASKLTLTGLANANADKVTFHSGAGDYSLDFSGALARPLTVNIDSGVSQITLIVPKGVSAVVNFDGALSNVDLRGDWQASGKQYLLQGSGPTITINLKLGAGGLVLKNHR